MVSVVMCMVTHLIGFIMNHDIDHRVVMIHQTTILHGLSTLREH